MQSAPFKPVGNNRSTNIAVTAAPTVLDTTTGGSTLETNYLVTNVGNNPVFFEMYPKNAPAPPSANVGTSPVVLPNSAQTFSGPPSAQFSVIAGAVGNTLYVTPGEGI